MSTAPPRPSPPRRPRSTLWQAATGVACQGCDELALTLLTSSTTWRKCPSSPPTKLTDGSTTTRFPMGKTLDDAQPVVETVPGWHCDITGVRRFEDLPRLLRTMSHVWRSWSAARSSTSPSAPSAMPASCGSNFSPWPLPEEARTYNQPKGRPLQGLSFSKKGGIRTDSAFNTDFRQKL